MPATQALAEQYWGGRPPFSFRGFMAVLDGAPVGVAGTHRALGRVWAFSDFKEALRPFRKTRVVAVRLMLKLLDSFPCPVYAVASPVEETAGPLLTRVGFRPTGETFEGNVILVRR